MVTMTGTRPGRMFEAKTRISSARSSSDSRNCSE
jgi:hypothetical protein